MKWNPDLVVGKFWSLKDSRGEIRHISTYVQLTWIQFTNSGFKIGQIRIKANTKRTFSLYFLWTIAIENTMVLKCVEIGYQNYLKIRGLLYQLELVGYIRNGNWPTHNWSRNSESKLFGTNWSREIFNSYPVNGIYWHFNFWNTVSSMLKKWENDIDL